MSDSLEFGVPTAQCSTPEPVRLVVWDLDETFWLGTLSEGGIREYVEAHHNVVVTLARRGIISSICSKNDHALVEAVLREKGIWEYFVFPSINWDPKGARLRALIDSAGLRPHTVMFIDDNHGNRAEAASAVPGIQVADEKIIGVLLESPLFQGKDDRELTRLAQYRLLEQRKRDEAEAGGNNEEFLRSSNIRVMFEYDIEKHVYRAIELINRTNQLNFTKVRLPENPEDARVELLRQTNLFYRQAALIRVVDRYGDYGYCGFFLRSNGQGSGPGHLLHYCFSCRTLGMSVEQWVYDHIGRPTIKVIGETLSSLPAHKPIDWVKLADFADGNAAETHLIPEVRLRGGCEMDALSHYFTNIASVCRREGSLNRGPFFVPKDCSHHITIVEAETLEPEYVALAEQCGFIVSDFETNLFSDCAPGTLIVYSTWSDMRNAYRHRASGRLLTVVLPDLYDDLAKMANSDIDAILAKRAISASDQELVRRAVNKLRSDGEYIGRPPELEVRHRLTQVFSAMPCHAKVAILGVDENYKDKGGIPTRRWPAVAYNRMLRQLADQFDAKVFMIGDFVQDEKEFEFTDHFGRIVYFRLASAIIKWAGESRGSSDSSL